MLLGFMKGSARANVSSANPLPVEMNSSGLCEWWERESTASGAELTAAKAAPGAGKRHLITGFSAAYFTNAASPGYVTVTLKAGDEVILVQGAAYVSVATDGGVLSAQFPSPIEVPENTAASLVVEADEAVKLDATLLGRTVDV